MKIKFTLAGALLMIAGLLHLASLFLTPLDSDAVLPGVFDVVFGVIYLVLGFFLLRLKDTYLTNTAVVVLFGLIVDLSIYSTGVDGIPLAMLLVEAFALVVLAYLYLQSRAPLSRV